MSNEALDKLSFFVKVSFYLNSNATLMIREQEEGRKERRRKGGRAEWRKEDEKTKSE